MTAGEERDLGSLPALFRKRFDGEASAVVRAPGRVNLIGEHTDYNGGFVLPMAVDRDVRIALRPRGDRLVRIHSVDLSRDAQFDLDTLQGAAPTPGRGEPEHDGWAEYVKGVAWSLGQAGHELNGFDAALSGDVPRGAGLSSSAALELAAARAFWTVSPFHWRPVEMALACQRAENSWLGVSSGIMDQLVSAAGSEGHALLIDCRTLTTRPVPLPSGTAVLVLDTSTRRGLVGSAYNERRQQCEEAARHFGVDELRDLSLEELESEAEKLPPLLLKRARHVVGENARTLAAAEAMEQGDSVEMGRLMNLSHYSLRDDFEVSSPALDVISACARELDGCYGARLTGAGFGGCAVALVAAEAASQVSRLVGDCYLAATGRQARAYLCQPAQGAGELTPGAA
jgi:galactokinase